MEPLELLAEPPGLPAFPLPDALARLYPGTLGFPRQSLYANFVQSVDGVVALPGVPGSNRLIADASESDRLVMAILRACADVVLVGAGTLRASPRSRWTPEAAFPGAAAALAELRQGLGLAPEPALAIVTSGAGLPLDHPALERRPIVLTTPAGAERLRPRLPSAEIVGLAAEERVEPSAAVAELRRRGHGRILSEGGPILFGSLLQAGLVDELFLTVSPLIAGRRGGGGALGIAETTELLPGRRLRMALTGARRSGDHLFLRYAIGPPA